MCAWRTLCCGSTGWEGKGMEIVGLLLVAAGVVLALVLAWMGPQADHESARRLLEGGTIRRA